METGVDLVKAQNLVLPVKIPNFIFRRRMASISPDRLASLH